MECTAAATALQPLAVPQQELLQGGGGRLNRVHRIQRLTSPAVARGLGQARTRVRAALDQAAARVDDLLAAIEC